MTEAPAEATTEAKKTEPTFADDMQRMAYEQLAHMIAERNSLVGTVNAANGDRSALVDQITEEDNDPEIVAAREARDEAIERLESLVRPKVEALVNEGAEGLAESEAKIKEIEGTVKPGINFYKKVYGDDAAEFLPALTRVRSSRISNAGTGGRRIRGYELTVTIDGEVTGYENFASAAKDLDIDTTVLQDGFFQAAGNPKQVKDAPDQVSFSLTITEVDEDEQAVEKTVTVLATRKDADDS